jgi:ATP-dependent Zn protease
VKGGACTRQELLALHEAGHAVVAAEFGWQVELATIEPDGDRNGHVEYLVDDAHLDDLYADEARVREAMVCLAGPYAVRMARGYPYGSKDADHDCAEDDGMEGDEYAALVALVPCSRDLMYKARRKAARLIRKLALRIHTLAAALVERGTLTGVEIHALLDGAK